MTTYDELTKKPKNNLRVRKACVSKHSIQNVLGCMLALCLTSVIGCDIMNKNMCQTNFNHTFNQSDTESFTRLYIHRHCSKGEYYSPKCKGDTTYKCIQNDFGFTIEFCSPIRCNRDDLSCIAYYDETTSSVVWIEFRKCDYGYFSNPYSKCHKDVRVERSGLYPNKAYCDWQNDFYNKKELMYFDVTTTRDYRKLCIQNNTHCDSGKRPLPDGTCSPICGRDEVRTELSGFSCVSPEREQELRNLTTTGRVITTQENSEHTTGRGSSTSPTRGSFNSPTTRTPRTLSSKPTDAPSYKPGDLFHDMTRLTIVLISIVSVIAVIVVIAAVFMAMKNGGSDISNSNIPPSCSDDGWQPTVEVPWQNREMDDRDMSFIARNIGAGWETLASHLQCSRVSIDHIKSDKSSMGVQILTMLQQWKQQHHQATLQYFNEEMRDMRTVKDVSIQWSALDSRFGIPDNAL